MGSHLNFTGKILLAQLAAACGAAVLDGVSRGSAPPVDLNALPFSPGTVDSLKTLASYDLRGLFDNILTSEGLPESSPLREALWIHYRGR